ncbi:MAG: hypothetical protein RLZZ28_688 [Bacteroidota bacterium]
MEKLPQFLLLSLVLISCNLTSCSNNKGNDSTQNPGALAVIEPLTKEFLSKTGKIFVVEESHSNAAGLSDLKVYFKGESTRPTIYGSTDPVKKIILADLDLNGFDEIYIITSSASAGSYGNLYATASNKDKSLSMIYLPGISEKDREKGADFDGYQGHDKFEIAGNALLRSYPIKGDTITQRLVQYQLKAGEAGYILRVQHSKIISTK